jgi:replication fork protection complex subunit Csm3/Swi3
MFKYSDIARLLNFYQLWLDDLYPRAKFADGLAIIEKLGHTKRMQTMRREWINEAKSKDYLARGPESEARARTVGETGLHEDLNLSNPIRSHDRSKTPVGNSVDDEDLYCATPRKLSDKRKEEPSGDIDESLFLSDFENDSSPSGDELDALLAEDNDRDTTTNAIEIHVNPDPQIKIKETEPTFDDEMEAMGDMW